MKKMKNQQQDNTVITLVLENCYFKGIYEGNLDLLTEVYNRATLLFGDVKGQPYAKTLDQYLAGVKNRQSAKDSSKPFKEKSYLLNWVTLLPLPR